MGNLGLGRALPRMLPTNLAALFGGNGDNVALRTGPKFAMRTANQGPTEWFSRILLHPNRS